MSNSLRILSWNTQNGKGCDGLVDLDRTIAYIKAQAPLDLICLQEVARFFPDYTTPEHPDQLTALAQAFPDHTPVWGAALSWPGSNREQRQEFGNLTLTRLPLLDRRVHCLPGAVAGGNANAWRTPRCVVETLVETDTGPLRILNTHLAYHDDEERHQQLRYLDEIQQAALRQYQHRCDSAPGIFAQPWATDHTVLCGDLNMDSRQDEYHAFTRLGWQDAATAFGDAQRRQPTCGIHDRDQWPDGPHCRDYFWLQQVQATALDVDTNTPLSDHQPLVLTLEH